MIAPLAPLTWKSLKATWSARPARERRGHLAAAASLLHALWSQHHDLAALNWDDVAFESIENKIRAYAPTALPVRRREISQATLIHLLVRWQNEARLWLSPFEQAFFLQTLLLRDGVDPATRKLTQRQATEWTNNEIRARARSIYQTALKTPSAHKWIAAPDMTFHEMSSAVEDALTSQASVAVKKGERIHVIRANLMGQDVLIKRYILRGAVERLKYRWRASRARRAWAAAAAMRAMNVRTPEPLGFWERREGGVVADSLFITRFIEPSIPAYRFLKRHYRQYNADARERFRKELLDAYLSIERAGLHHADTKLSNLLVRHPDNETQRELLWIDLECIAAGARPTRHRVVRNLVQMNGSMRRWISENDRMSFLRDLARVHPWVISRRVISKIKTWTRRRLLRELHRQTQPDGARQVG